MKDIHPMGIHAADQFGTTIVNPKSPIAVPKKPSNPGFGTSTKAIKPHGGDQYGTTITKSNPFRDFPKANVKLSSGVVEQKGSRISVDSEKVIRSQHSGGMKLSGQLTGGGHSASGCMPGTSYRKSGGKSNTSARVF